MARTTWTLTDSYDQPAGTLVDDDDLGVWVEYPADQPALGPPARFGSVEEATTLLDQLAIAVTPDG